MMHPLEEGSTRGPSQQHILVESPLGVGSSECPESVQMIGTLSALTLSADGSSPYPIHSSPLRSTAGPPTAYVRVLWDGTRPYTEQTMCTKPGSSPPRPPNPLSPQPCPSQPGKLILPVHRPESPHLPRTSSTLLSNLECELSISMATTLAQASMNPSSHLDRHNNLLSGFLFLPLSPRSILNRPSMVILLKHVSVSALV